MTIGPRFRLNMSKIGVIAVCWMLISLFFALYDSRLLYSNLSAGPSDAYSFQVQLILNAFVGLISGIVGGIFLVYVVGEFLRKSALGFTLFITGISYIVIFVFVASLLAVLQVYLKGLHFDSFAQFNNALAAQFKEPIIFPVFILWAFITLATQFMLQVNDKFGPGILRKFLMGQYTQPRQEERIFMFLDLRSSTTIAEQIGSQRYFNLLQDFFSDITNTVIAKKGEIYQYVGDEIVLSWTMERGLKNANCIHCFFEINKTIQGLSSQYLEKYGLIPQYKAGLHFGSVTAGEIGIIKREIVYSGDVLNTASRIQELCNKYDVDILVSKPMIDLLDQLHPFEHKLMGEFELRGRLEKIELTTVSFAQAIA